MRNFSKGEREDKKMYRATCAECGRSCEVPFKPSGDKPVYCSNCFKKDDSPRSYDRDREDRGRDRNRGSERGGERGSERGRLTMHRATCAECGRSCEVPFKPSGDKPVYCSSCFGRGPSDNPAPSKPDQSGKKFDAINEKLDQILFLLKNCNSGKESTKETIKKPGKKVSKKKAK